MMPIARLAIRVLFATLVASIAGRADAAPAWGDLLVVRPSSVLVSGSACLFDGKFLRCDGTAPTGGLAVADRIVSGTSGVYVSDSGVINFNTGGHALGLHQHRGPAGHSQRQHHGECGGGRFSPVTPERWWATDTSARQRHGWRGQSGHARFCRPVRNNRATHFGARPHFSRSGRSRALL